MRLSENMERFIRRRKPHTTTGSDTDKRILNDSFDAMDETIRGQSVDGKPNICKRIVQSRITRIAAAAVIIVAIGAVVHRVYREHTDGQIISQPARSPAEMLTFVSLTMAYRHGGIEALERQCEQAVELLGPRTKNLSVRELFEELNSNGDNSERTEL
jgi:hypothetical protein